MIRSRLIHEDLFDNAEYRNLSSDQLRLALITLIVLTDDWGRGRSTILSARAGIAPDILDEAMDEIERTEIIRFYGDHRQYYYAPKFFVFQELERQRQTKIPPPDDAEYLSHCAPLIAMAGQQREQARIRKRRQRMARLVDGTQDTPPPLTDPSLNSAPVDIPHTLRDDWGTLAKQYGNDVADRAVAAARRIFGIPTARQMVATFQAAHDAGVVDKPMTEWPDFRNRLRREHVQKNTNLGAGGTDEVRRAKYKNIGEKVKV